jgi:DNA-binding transcriptional ArsR family regulator
VATSYEYGVAVIFLAALATVNLGLTRGPASVSQLAEPFAMALQSVAQHIGVLETAGIVTSTKVGRVRTVQLVPAALAAATPWISRQQLPAEQRLDRLESFLAGSDASPREGE